MEYRKQLNEFKMDAERREKDSRSLEGCTFAPQTNKSSNQQSGKKLGRDSSQAGKKSTTRLGNTALKKKQAKQPLYAKKGETKQLQLARQELQARRDQELAECTFKPKIKQYQKKPEIYPDPLLAAIDYQIEVTSRPKGYQEAVDRMRKHKELRDNKQKEMDRKLTGENYINNRQLLDKPCPPSFLNKQDRSAKKPEQLLSIEVSITPTRSGRIGIKEGDDLNVLAANFCKAYQLQGEMHACLVEQLQEHLNNYYIAKQNENRRKQQKLEQQWVDREHKKLMASQALVKQGSASSFIDSNHDFKFNQPQVLPIPKQKVYEHDNQ